jgi:hypothetical protein
MSVRSFHSVFMASAVAGAALGCYLVSLRVASERAALEQVESQIVQTQSNIRLLQTEVGTRSRLAQLERWNVRALALSAPAADQILADKFQLANFVQPEPKHEIEAPVVLASAPAPMPSQPLAENPNSDGAAPPSGLLHEASLKVETRPAQPARAAVTPAVKAPDQKPQLTASAARKPTGEKAGDKHVKSSPEPMTKPVRTAKVDPLAPLPADSSKAKVSRTNR